MRWVLFRRLLKACSRWNRGAAGQGNRFRCGNMWLTWESTALEQFCVVCLNTRLGQTCSQLTPVSDITRPSAQCRVTGDLVGKGSNWRHPITKIYTLFSKWMYICLMKSLIILFPVRPILALDPILKMLSTNARWVATSGQVFAVIKIHAGTGWNRYEAYLVWCGEALHQLQGAVPVGSTCERAFSLQQCMSLTYLVIKFQCITKVFGFNIAA